VLAARVADAMSVIEGILEVVSGVDRVG
jgi:hypothetical protein